MNISPRRYSKRPLSGSSLTIASCNVEGINSNKEDLLAEMCKETMYDVLCMQETRRNEEMKTPKINGMKLVTIRPNKNSGSAIFVRTFIQVTLAHITEKFDIKILIIEIGKCTVTSIYKPPNVLFTFKKPLNLNAHKTNFVIF